MLYRPGSQSIHGYMLDYTIVDATDVEQMLTEGWFLTTTEAGESAQPQPVLSDEAAPTREELEAKATELGIKFDGRNSDKKLGDLIAATLET